MDIGLASVAMGQMSVMDGASIAVLKKAMDSDESMNSQLISMLGQNTKQMELSVNPNLGSNYDVSI